MIKRINFKQISQLDHKWVKSKINEFIKEDMPDGDITTNLTISNDKVVSSKMIAMESFIFCGGGIFTIHVFLKPINKLVPKGW